MKNYYLNIFEYEFWANKEIIDFIILNDAPEKVMYLASHIVNAHILWLKRIENKVSDTGVWTLYDKNKLGEVYSETSKAFKKYLTGVDMKELERIVHYKNTKGESFKSYVSDILTHLTHHSSYHRGQIILLLKQNVYEVPYVDYIHFARNIKKAM